MKLGLYRTSKVNYVPYYTDGNGRDRYIAVERGGLFPNNSVNPENIRRTGTLLHTKVSYKSVSPYPKSPNFHYHSDGNGRDSYIYSNGGGLIYDSKPLNSYKLTDFLRPKENDYITINKNEQIYSSKNKEKYQKILKEKEKDIINRLYENEKQKQKFNNKKKDANNDILNEIDEIKLPKIIDKNSYNTVNRNIKIENSKENKNEETLDYNSKKNKNYNIFIKSKNNSNLDSEQFMKYISKINNFDEEKRLKKNNKSFNQAYLHLRNINNNYS